MSGKPWRQRFRSSGLGLYHWGLWHHIRGQHALMFCPLVIQRRTQLARGAQVGACRPTRGACAGPAPGNSTAVRPGGPEMWARSPKGCGSQHLVRTGLHELGLRRTHVPQVHFQAEWKNVRGRAGRAPPGRLRNLSVGSATSNCARAEARLDPVLTRTTPLECSDRSIDRGGLLCSSRSRSAVDVGIGVELGFFGSPRGLREATAGTPGVDRRSAMGRFGIWRGFIFPTPPPLEGSPVELAPETCPRLADSLTWCLLDRAAIRQSRAAQRKDGAELESRGVKRLPPSAGRLQGAAEEGSQGGLVL